MPLSVNAFINASRGVNATRNILSTNNADGTIDVQKGRLGRLSITHAAKNKNSAVMSLFSEAMEREYGTYGAKAFSEILASRAGSNKSLRAMDIRRVVGKADLMQKAAFVNEAKRQRDTHPQLVSLSDAKREAVIRYVIAEHANLPENKSLTGADLAEVIDSAITDAMRDDVLNDLERPEGFDDSNGVVAEPSVNATEKEVRATDPVGLKRLNSLALGKTSSSVEDRMRAGTLTSGMRINTEVGETTTPMLLEKLKSNGVEPGFIYRNDWNTNNTRGLMAVTDFDFTQNGFLDIAREAPQGSALRAACDESVQIMMNPTRQDEIPSSMLRIALEIGPHHGASTAYAAEYMIRLALDPSVPADPTSALGQLRSLLERDYPQYMATSDRPLPPIGASLTGIPEGDLAVIKNSHFSTIRDAVLQGPPKGDPFRGTAAFKHFSTRHIAKLDYNEGDRSAATRATRSASGGFLHLPQRIRESKGVLFHTFRVTTAEKASIGAVSEALANDLTRLCGIPAQELSLVRGQYSDGTPKIMLEAKFAKGYQDFDGNFLKDGRISVDSDEQQPEALGRYKAMFLLLADRDAVGSHGQNKGLINGKTFFAIDPGHSLEGNGKSLEIHDNFSFRDTKIGPHGKRFANFSVFDDDTRYNKLQGVLELRRLFTEVVGDDGQTAIDKLFSDYRAAFPTTGGTREENALNVKIQSRINEMETELRTQMARITEVFHSQLAAYDAIEPALRAGTIELTENLEKLTSPTTWKSKNGEVKLTHLEVIEETRIPWKVEVQGDNIVYTAAKAIPEEAQQALQDFLPNGTGGHITFVRGVPTLTVPRADAERIFSAFNEQRIAEQTHPEEFAARVTANQDINLFE